MDRIRLGLIGIAALAAGVVSGTGCMRPAQIQDAPLAKQARHDSLTAMTGYQGTDASSLRSEMADVRQFDQESAARESLSKAAASVTPTKQLVLDFLKSSEWVVLTQYNDPNVGLYRLSLTSPIISELLNRKDFAEGIVAAYRTFDVDPRTNRSYGKESGPMALDVMEMLVASKSLLPKMRGHEKQLLAAMCDRYWARKRVNTHYKPQDRPYPENPFALGLAYALAGQMGMKLPPGVRIDPKTGSVEMKTLQSPNYDSLVVKFQALAS